VSVLDLLLGEPTKGIQKAHDWVDGQCQTCGTRTDDGGMCKRPHLGRCVTNACTDTADLRYTSVSQVVKARSCLRQWFFEKVLQKLPEKDTWQNAGTDLHEDIKQYYRSGGINTLGPLAMTGKHLLPDPGPDLWVEREISGLPQLSAPKLFLDGVPFIGAPDLMHTRGTNKGAEDFDDTIDPAHTLEVCDHKSTGGDKANKKPLAYALTSNQLRTDVQMVGYAQYGLEVIPALQYVRLSHHYFLTTKSAPAVKRTVLVPADEIRETWESFSPVVRSMRQAAKCGDQDDVPANTKACEAYGGCKHMVYCHAGNPLARMMASVTSEETRTMGLLDRLNIPGKADAPDVGVAINMDAQIAALANKEAATKAPAYVLPDGFADAYKVIQAAGLGWPVVKGDAARAKAFVEGVAYTPDAAYAGSGTLGSLPPQDDPKVIVEIADNLCARDASLRARALGTNAQVVATIAPGQVNPPDQPKSDPVAHTTVAAVNTPAATQETTTTEAPKPKRGRPPGSGRKPKADAAMAIPTGGEPVDGFNLYVDCMVSPADTSLHDYVDALVQEICAHFTESDGKPAVDIRCATNKALAGGAWRGVLSQVTKEAVTEGKIPSGNYDLYTQGDEVCQVVATALRSVADIYVRGY
jgi:hypothetical protein